MSDANTDIARDQQRADRFSVYIEAVRAFVSRPTAKNRKRAIAAAQETDGVSGGYFGGRTDLAKGVENMLDNLRRADKKEWGKLLSSLRKNRDAFSRLKALSPFKDRMLMVVDYGNGFVSQYGEAQSFADSAISRTGMMTYDGDTYLVAIPAPDPATAEVVWIKCGKLGEGIPTDRPRLVRRPRLKRVVAEAA